MTFCYYIECSQYSQVSIQFKDREAFCTLVESLVQMTCSDFTNFLRYRQITAFCYGKQWKVYLFTKKLSNQGVD